MVAQDSHEHVSWPQISAEDGAKKFSLQWCHVIWLRHARLPRQAAVPWKGTARGARGTRGGADGLSGSEAKNKAVARDETAKASFSDARACAQLVRILKQERFER